MTLNVSYTTDLEVKSDRTPVDRAFFNRRFKALYDELSRLDTDVSGFGQTEDTLVQLGLDRLNETLGPLLVTLQNAAELGFLVCRSIGDAHSLVGGEFVGWHITEGAELFTPTHFLLALDETDYTNWGILSVDPDGWHASTGELSTHVAFASKTKSGTQWQLSASAAQLPAMNQMLADSNAAKASCQASEASVNSQMASLSGLAAAIAAGPVASVAGRTGVVVLAESDIAGLVSDLASKATTTFVTSQIAGKQDASAKLDAFVNLAWAANKVQYSTGANTQSQFDITDFAKTLVDDVDASTALSTLGVSPFIKTVLDDTTAAAVRATLGVAATPDLPVKASLAEVAIGTDDVKFATAAGISNTYLPRTVTVNSQAATGYTLVSSDHGNIMRFTSALAIACYLPASAQVGFNTMIEQAGTGQVTISVAVNATRRSFGSKFKLAGQNAVASVVCVANSDGGHAEWTVSGNLIA